MNPYRSLWKAVYLNALREALSFDAEAIDWLLYEDDARRVCECAGVDLDMERPRLGKLLVMKARTAAEGVWPRFKPGGTVAWTRASARNQRLAQAFLRSDKGRALLARHSNQIPKKPEALMAELYRACMAATGRSAGAIAA